VDVIIDHINIGAAAPPPPLQVCAVVRPQWAELYGADGLVDDPASGLAYSDGAVRAASPTGLGVAFDAAATDLIRHF
ncbi:MAG: hypothetical protein V4764_00125, partial [Burkholderia sp.]